MSADPINDFQAPTSPWTEQLYSPSLSLSHGGKLLRQTSDFYAWYMAWVKAPHEHASSFKYLSLIGRIAEVSQEGGFYLSNVEEQKALIALSLLCEGLYNGFLKPGGIETSLKEIVESLTATNHKARLVSVTTELEYLFCIRSNLDNENQLKIKHFLIGLIHLVSPLLRDMDAKAIAKELFQILKNPDSVEDIHQALYNAVNRWLPI